MKCKVGFLIAKYSVYIVSIHNGLSPIEARYPNYNAVIPKDNPNKLTVDRLALLAGLRRCRLKPIREVV